MTLWWSRSRGTFTRRDTGRQKPDRLDLEILEIALSATTPLGKVADNFDTRAPLGVRGAFSETQVWDPVAPPPRGLRGRDLVTSLLGVW